MEMANREQAVGECGCDLRRKDKALRHSDLDAFGVIHKAYGELDPLGFLSGSKFTGYERLLADWMRLRVLSAVTNSLEEGHSNAQSLSASLSRHLILGTDLVPDELRAFLQGQVESGSLMGASELGPSFVPTISLPNIEETVERQVQHFSQIGNHAASGELSKIVAEGLKRGDTYRDMAKRIQLWAKKNGDMDRVLKYRAETIARTESSRALVSGQVESWKSSGVVREVEWLLAPHPCQFCRALYQRGQARISLSKPGEPDTPFLPFPSTLIGTDGGTMRIDYRPITGPPLHPNCRCALKPIVEV